MRWDWWRGCAQWSVLPSSKPAHRVALAEAGGRPSEDQQVLHANPQRLARRPHGFTTAGVAFVVGRSRRGLVDCLPKPGDSAALEGRQPASGVRGPRGAGRWNGGILRQQVTESVVLPVLGGALGLIVAQWTLAALSPMPSPIDAAATPSMARALIAKGAPAVLAWRRPVRDVTATQAAREIYGSLPTGFALEKGLGRTLKDLTRRADDGKWHYPDWHLLQLYRDSTPLGALVTPPGVDGRTKAKPIEPEKEFLGTKPVAGPAEFVGRRRPMQRCLRALVENKVVVLWGVGGLGKSSVAARLVRRMRQRLQNTKEVVIRGKLTEQILRDRLSQEKYGGIFRSQDDSLRAQLHEFLDKNTNLLIVLDNFEDNQEIRGGSASSSKELPWKRHCCYIAGAKGMSSKPMDLALARNLVSCFF